MLFQPLNREPLNRESEQLRKHYENCCKVTSDYKAAKAKNMGANLKSRISQITLIASFIPLCWLGMMNGANCN